LHRADDLAAEANAHGHTVTAAAVDGRSLDLDLLAQAQLVAPMVLAVVVQHLGAAVVEAHAIDDDRAEAADRAAGERNGADRRRLLRASAATATTGNERAGQRGHGSEGTQRLSPARGPGAARG
jgi:hypothetical protein